MKPTSNKIRRGPTEQVRLGLPFEREKVKIIFKKSKFKIVKLKARSANELINFGIIN